MNSRICTDARRFVGYKACYCLKVKLAKHLNMPITLLKNKAARTD
ncbi:hypothetical protein ALT721_1090052 [Alteromonas alvinellae]